MAIITNYFSVDNQAGADLNNPQTISVTTNPEIPAPRSALGDILQGTGGSQWVFVQASATITAFNVIGFDESFQARNASVNSASVTLSKTYALAEFQASVAAPGDYFWAMVAGRGGAQANVVTTAAAGVQMWLSSTCPGCLTTTVSSSATNPIMYGIAAVTALTSVSSSPVEVVFEYMRASN